MTSHYSILLFGAAVNVRCRAVQTLKSVGAWRISTPDSSHTKMVKSGLAGVMKFQLSNVMTPALVVWSAATGLYKKAGRYHCKFFGRRARDGVSIFSILLQLLGADSPALKAYAALVSSKMVPLSKYT